MNILLKKLYDVIENTNLEHYLQFKLLKFEIFFKIASSTDLAYRKSGSLVSIYYVVCE